MVLVIFRKLLGVMLMNPALKTQVINQLRDAAKKTDSKIDDAAVDTFEAVWDVVVPIVVAKK